MKQFKIPSYRFSFDNMGSAEVYAQNMLELGRNASIVTYGILTPKPQITVIVKV